jgi:O-antigen/teichoic acid export membrane protein
MSIDPTEMRRRFTRMAVICTLLTLVAVGLAFAHFSLGIGWALWGFVGVLALSFGVQLWFVGAMLRAGKGGK